MSKKSVATTTIGFFVVGLLAWMHGLPLAGWTTAWTAGGGTVPLAMILVVVGVLTFLQDEAVDAVIFLGFAALAWSHSPARGGAMNLPESAYGWNLIIFTVLFLGIWWGSRASGGTRTLFLLAMWLTLLADAIKHWSGVHVFALIEGYIGLVSGLLALLTAVRAIACSSSSAATAN